MNKISIHIIENINKLQKEKRKYKEIYKKEPTTKELAHLLNTTEEKILELEKIITDTEPKYLKIKPFNINDLSEKEYKELINKLECNKNLLNEKEQEIISLSLGLIDNKKWTLKELADKYHITEQRARQIQAKSIRIIKHPERKNIKNYLK